MATLPLEKNPGTKCTGDCVGPTAGLAEQKNLLLLSGFKDWIVQPIPFAIY